MATQGTFVRSIDVEVERSRTGAGGEFGGERRIVSFWIFGSFFLCAASCLGERGGLGSQRVEDVHN